MSFRLSAVWTERAIGENQQGGAYRPTDGIKEVLASQPIGSAALNVELDADGLGWIGTQATLRMDGFRPSASRGSMKLAYQSTNWTVPPSWTSE